VIADKGYDSDSVIEKIEAVGAKVVIPPKSNRKNPRRYSKRMYKERNVIERFFARLKQWRGVATRYEKTIESYMAMVFIACAMLWLL